MASIHYRNGRFYGSADPGNGITTILYIVKQKRTSKKSKSLSLSFLYFVTFNVLIDQS